jgi:uncharacterized membrane protein (UPF0127 family)
LKKRLLVTPSGWLLIVDVARTPKELAYGLTGCRGLAPYRGMLFAQPKPGVYRYWMYGVPISLDILWLDEGLRILEIVPRAEPGSTVPLGTTLRSKFGLELAAGMVDRYGLRVGQSFQALPG